MTREEAIKIINCYDIGFYDLSGEKIPADKLAEAFDMAIEALQQEPVRKEGDNMRKKYTYILESMDEIKLALSRLETDVADIWKSIKSDNFEKAEFEAGTARPIALELQRSAFNLYLELTKLEGVGHYDKQ